MPRRWKRVVTCLLGGGEWARGSATWTFVGKAMVRQLPLAASWGWRWISYCHLHYGNYLLSCSFWFYTFKKDTPQCPFRGNSNKHM